MTDHPCDRRGRGEGTCKRREPGQRHLEKVLASHSLSKQREENVTRIPVHTVVARILLAILAAVAHDLCQFEDRQRLALNDWVWLERVCPALMEWCEGAD